MALAAVLGVRARPWEEEVVEEEGEGEVLQGEQTWAGLKGAFTLVSIS